MVPWVCDDLLLSRFTVPSPTLGGGDALFFHSRTQRLDAIDSAVFKDEESCADDFPHSGRHAGAEKAGVATGTGERTVVETQYPSQTQQISYHEVGPHRSGEDRARVYADERAAFAGE
jgi:hypothetical protein